jgi:GNAT superfamily N-acetyltransferase
LSDKKLRVREASTFDLVTIVDFISEEAIEAEGRIADRNTLERGIGAALDDDSLAKYWLLVDESEIACGCTSVVQEWSDWNAGFYWWIQSMYIVPGHRGKGCLNILMDHVANAARTQHCLELRLYVHDQNKTAVRAYEKVGFGSSTYMIMSKPI